MQISLSEADIAGLIRSQAFGQAVREAMSRDQACIAAAQAQKNYIEGIVNNIFASRSTLDSLVIDGVIERLKKEAVLPEALRAAARSVVDAPEMRKLLTLHTIAELEAQIARLREFAEDR
jgi:hypothetical protein